MLMRYAIVVTVLAPAAGAMSVALAGTPRRVRGVAIAATAIAFLAAMAMWVRFEPRGAEWQFDRQIDLVPSLGLRGIVGVDGFSVSLIAAVTLIAAVCAVWTTGRDVDERARRAWIALLSMEAGVVGVLVSLDLMQAAIFWAVAVAAAWRALRIEGSAEGQRGPREPTLVVPWAAVALAGVVMVLRLRYRALSGFGTFDFRALQTLALGPGVQLSLLAALLPALALPLYLLAVRIHGAAVATSGRAFAEGIPSMVFLASLLPPVAMYWLVRVGMTILPAGLRRASPYLIAACAIAALAAAVTAIRHAKDFGIVVLSSSAIGWAIALASLLMLTPSTITWAVVLQVVQSIGAAGLMLAATAGHGLRDAPALYTGLRNALVLAPLMLALAGLAFGRAPLLTRLETSVARVVLRVSPEYAPQVADCLSQPPQPPDPAETGLPAGMVLTAPCADAQSDAHGKH